MDNEWRVKIIDKGYTDTREVYIYCRSFGGVNIIRGDKSEFIKEGEQTTPSLFLTPQALQAFSDALNSQGFKPQGGFVEGKLEATEKHLEDMRTLVLEKK